VISRKIHSCVIILNILRSNWVRFSWRINISGLSEICKITCPCYEERLSQHTNVNEILFNLTSHIPPQLFCVSQHLTGR
jgi:hypothetical protein